MGALGKLWRIVTSGGSTKTTRTQRPPAHTGRSLVKDNKEDTIRRTFTFNGKAVIKFVPNHEGDMMQSKKVEAFIHPGGSWVDLRGEDGAIVSVPSHQIFEIEWVEDDER